MMSNSVTRRTRIPHFLDIATYVGMVAMSILGISGLPSLQAQLLALGLVLLFGVLYHFVFQSGRYVQNPNLYFGAQALILGLLFLLGSNNSDAFNFLFLILCIHIAAVSRAQVAALWGALCYAIVSLITLTMRGPEGIYAVVFYSITFLVSGFFGYTIQQMERERSRNQQLVEELQATQRKLQELAVVEERNRLARDLHDSVKQHMYAISMQLGAARMLLEDGHRAYAPVTESERLAKQAGAELTTLIRELRPPSLESKTLAVGLQDYLTEWARQNKIETRIHIDNDLPLSVNEEQAFFRVVQEALSNIARHSQATQVTVELRQVDSDILFCIADTGKGFDANLIKMGVGLDSMRERLAQIGASFRVQSEIGSGTQITSTLRRT
jgi:signal transduction histidine kinase